MVSSKIKQGHLLKKMAHHQPLPKNSLYYLARELIVLTS